MPETERREVIQSVLNTPPDSDERRALKAKWANHHGHDGTIHPTITTGCRFGSGLRDDVCRAALHGRDEETPA
jgi:hypothetical protein